MTYLHRLPMFIEDDSDPENISEVKPERNLIAAVLARAICDAFGTQRTEQHLVRTARHWMFSRLTPKRPYSYAWVCVHLDLDAEKLRTALKDRSLDSEEMQKCIMILRS